MAAERRTAKPTRAATRPGHAGQVRLRTLVLIRWVAVGGQAAALLAVYAGLGFTFPLGPAFLAVAASALLNVAVSIRFPPTRRLGDGEAAAYLAYDIVQLAALLYLTGGLSNPFALLVIVPVTISATVLSLRSTIRLAALALGCISLLAFLHLPLPWSEGGLALDRTYVFGIWTALSLGLLFLAAYAWRVAQEARHMSDALVATQMALSREQRLSSLGGLAAAAAHELATPLGTIALVAQELANDLPEGSALADDVALLRSQARRCRDILERLSARPGQGGDSPVDELPLSALVEVAAAPYRGGPIELDLTAPSGAQPVVGYSVEIIQGLGNLIENAVDFARHRVRLTLEWDEDAIRLAIDDDGPGFAPKILGLLGEPYLSTRRGHGGMGLGVFIARTLLERTGAELAFANRRDGGATVAVEWPRAALERAPAGAPAASGGPN